MRAACTNHRSRRSRVRVRPFSLTLKNEGAAAPWCLRLPLPRARADTRGKSCRRELRLGDVLASKFTQRADLLTPLVVGRLVLVGIDGEAFRQFDGGPDGF